MQGQIVVHKNKKTQQVEFPVTVEEAIVSSKGVNLADTLDELRGEINTLTVQLRHLEVALQSISENEEKCKKTTHF